MFQRDVLVASPSTTTRSAKSYGGRGLTADDMEASEILHSLCSLMGSERHNVFSVGWASKRKRSAARSEPSPPLLLPPLRWPESLKLQPKPPSPVTTLAIWRSESDDKAKESTKRKSKRRKRDELQSRVDELTKENQLLAEELEKKSTDCEQLRARNWALKAKKIEQDLGIRLPELDMFEEKSSNSTSTSGDHHQQIQSKINIDQITKTGTETVSCTTEVLPYPAFQVDPMLPSSIRSSDQNQNPLSPLGIPDLNLCPEEVEMDLVY